MNSVRMQRPAHIMCRALFVVIFSLYASATWGGMPNGPYVVFADLSGTKQSISGIIKNYMDSDRHGLFCGDIARSPLVFLYKRPEGLEDRRLEESLLQNNIERTRGIQEILANYRLRPDVNDGLDGVIIYTEDGGPKMIGIGVKGRAKVIKVIRPSSAKSVINSFCEAMPRIYRN